VLKTLYAFRLVDTALNRLTFKEEKITMRKRSFNALAPVCVAGMLMLAFAGCGATKNVPSGSTWEVAATTNLDQLTIADGAVIKAPEGKSLTMTVAGVEKPLQPGSYKGKIVLTPTENIPIKALMHGGTYNLRAAIYVDNGAVVPGKSVLSAVVGGKIANDSATDVSIASVGENFNGIIATGDSKYSIVNPKINFTGNGGNDFAGYGAAIMVMGKADVTIDKASITTNGVLRNAVWAGGESILHVNDSSIETGNPPLPPGAKDHFTDGGEVMMKVPFMLGMTGSCRATNLVESATAYYTNTHIKAQGWGALSTDASKAVRLYATNCIIETIDSGYGAYTLGGSADTFSGCTFNVVDMAVCGTGGDCIFTDGTKVNSGRFGVMYHGSGNITIEKGSVFKTKSTLLQLKSPGHNIVVDNAQLLAQNGIIIQTMANDDPNMRGGVPMSESGARGGAMPEGGAPGGALRGGEMPGGTKETNATFSNMTLNGDIINGNTAAEPVNITLKSATITGAISTAIVAHTLGPNGEQITMKTPELYKLIGEVTNTYCATKDKYGITVSLDAGSKWVVGKTSYITGLNVAEGASITAPEGNKVTMTVNGSEKGIRPGTYKGNIVLRVGK
jgi:hypothetical protein